MTLRGGTIDALAAARVFVAARGDSIRVSPHLYNDENDIERLLTLVRQSRR